MSTLKSINVQHPSATTTNIVNDSSGNVTVGNNLTVTGTSTLTGNATASGNLTVTGALVPASSFKRNRIINGNMLVDQRNAGASVTPNNGSYTLDRWQALASQASKFTVQQSTTAPTGFNNSLLVTSSSAYTVGASDYFTVSQAIEGYNVADFGFGTASAQTVTVSFWVRSSLTGTFGCSLISKYASGGRYYPATYSISAANTWEKKTITVSGDTTGTWPTDNSAGLYVVFDLGVGSTFSGTAGSWGGTYVFSPTGATSVVGTSGATFYITAVQLEVGTKATPYEMQIYSDQLAQCQRYYAKSYDVGTAPGTQVFNGEFLMQTFANNNLYCAVRYPVTMRTDPTLTFYPGYGAGASPVAGNFWNYGTSANIASAVGRGGSTGYSIEKNTGSASVTIGWQYTASAEL